MRHALFTAKEDVEQFCKIVQSLCDANHKPNTPIIVKYSTYIDHLGKWAVSMEYEPADMGGIEVADSVEQQQIGEVTK